MMICKFDSVENLGATIHVISYLFPTHILTVRSLESHRTTARVLVDLVHTGSSVLARVAETFVYI